MDLIKLRNVLDGSSLSKKTQDLYFLNLKKLMDLTNSKDLITLLNNSNYVKNIINNLDATDGSKLNFYISINSLLNKYYKNHNINTQFYKDEMNKLHEKGLKIQDSNQEPKNLKNKNITWNDIKKVEYTLRTNEYASLDHLLISLYVLQPPRRNTDFMNMKIVNTMEQVDDINNFIILKNHKFLINDYKTTRTHGKFETDVPAVLFKTILESIRRKPRTFLIVKSNNEPYSTSTSYGLKLKSIFLNYLGVNIGTSDLRHLYITEFLRRNPTTEGRKWLANQMGHNIMTQLNYNIINEEKEESYGL